MAMLKFVDLRKIKDFSRMQSFVYLKEKMMLIFRVIRDENIEVYEFKGNLGLKGECIILRTQKIITLTCRVIRDENIEVCRFKRN